MFFKMLNDFGENPQYNTDKTIIRCKRTTVLTTLYFFNDKGKFKYSNCYINPICSKKLGFNDD